MALKVFSGIMRYCRIGASDYFKLVETDFYGKIKFVVPSFFIREYVLYYLFLKLLKTLRFSIWNSQFQICSNDWHGLNWTFKILNTSGQVSPLTFDKGYSYFNNFEHLSKRQKLNSMRSLEVGESDVCFCYMTSMIINAKAWKSSCSEPKHRWLWNVVDIYFVLALIDY